MDVINVFSKLEPIKALLFSNSVFPNQSSDLLCNRDELWENSLHGLNPHNVGMYELEFKNISELENYLKTLDLFCVMRDGIYINFKPINILEYFKKDNIVGEYYNDEKYEVIEFTPELDDISYLRPFKFLNLTFRGTIEYRSVCTQPIKDVMTVGAFHLGLHEKIQELKKILDEDTVIYNNGYNASELRKLLIKEEIPSFINKNDLYELSRKIVDLSYEGLVERNKGEEIFLNPLYLRIDKKTNPAKEILKLNSNKEFKEIIFEYGKVNSSFNTC